MSFHADFWVVAGTAAPVIAISSILVLSDQVQLRADLSEVMDATPFREWDSMYRSIFLWFAATTIITAGQAATLVISLLSLLYESNQLPPTVVAVFQGMSLFYLALVCVILVRQKSWYKILKK